MLFRCCGALSSGRLSVVPAPKPEPSLWWSLYGGEARSSKKAAFRKNLTPALLPVVLDDPRYFYSSGVSENKKIIPGDADMKSGHYIENPLALLNAHPQTPSEVILWDL